MAGLHSCKRARGHEHGSPLGGGLQLCGFMQTVDSGEWAHQESHTTGGAATSLETSTSDHRARQRCLPASLGGALPADTEYSSVHTGILVQ